MLWNWSGTIQYGGMVLAIDWTGGAAAAAGTGVTVEDRIEVGVILAVQGADIQAGGIY
ncbi:MAG TPA: hypothetical protein VIM84_15090 [Gemmatimonadales bacterium]